MKELKFDLPRLFPPHNTEEQKKIDAINLANDLIDKEFEFFNFSFEIEKGNTFHINMRHKFLPNIYVNTSNLWFFDSNKDIIKKRCFVHYENIKTYLNTQKEKLVFEGMGSENSFATGLIEQLKACSEIEEQVKAKKKAEADLKSQLRKAKTELNKAKKELEKEKAKLHMSLNFQECDDELLFLFEKGFSAIRRQDHHRPDEESIASIRRILEEEEEDS